MKCQFRTVHRKGLSWHLQRASEPARKSLIKCSAAKAASRKAWTRPLPSRLCQAQISILTASLCSHGNLAMALLPHSELPSSHSSLYTCLSLPISKLRCPCPCRLLSSRLAPRGRLRKPVKFQLGSGGPKPKERNYSSNVRIKIVCQRN